MPATRATDRDDTTVAHYPHYAAAADHVARLLALHDGITVTVIGTGGNVPAILIGDDDRPRHDVIVSRNEWTEDACDRWVASYSYGEHEECVYASTATGAYHELLRRYDSPPASAVTA